MRKTKRIARISELMELIKQPMLRGQEEIQTDFEKILEDYTDLIMARYKYNLERWRGMSSDILFGALQAMSTKDLDSMFAFYTGFEALSSKLDVSNEANKKANIEKEKE
jgi:hypothetical protein